MSFLSRSGILLILAAGPGLVAQEAPLPEVAVAETVEGFKADSAPKRFDVVADNQHLESFLTELARRQGVQIHFLRLLDLRFNVEMQHATFEEVLTEICDSLDLAWRKNEDRSYAVGYPEDLEMAFDKADTSAPVEVAYHCRNVNVESLAESLAQTYPDLKVFSGPTYKSPTLNGASAAFSGPAQGSPGLGYPAMPGPMNGGGGMPGLPGMRSPGGADGSSHRFDVIVVGKPQVARRALAFARKLDSNRQQVRIDVQLLELTETNSNDLGIVWGLPGQPGGTPVVNWSEMPDKSLEPYVGTSGGLKFGAFGHSPAGVNLSLQAAEEKGRIKTLANPSLMVLDGERCSILIGDRLLYPKQTGVNSQGNATFDVAELKTGIYLQMAPQIGLDHDLVLSVYPQDSTVTSYENFGGTPYPNVTTREAQTTVHLRSGEMLVIGGLKMSTDKRSHNRIPLLGSIPVIGTLFGGRSKGKNTSELVLMIKPEIMDTEGPGSSNIKLATGPGSPQ